MFKKLLLSTLFAGSFGGIVCADKKTFLSPITQKIENKFGEKRSGPREMIEQLSLAFYYGGKQSDGSFDTLKGATTARDGLFKVASDVMLNNALFDFLSQQDNALTKEIYKKYYRVWSRLGFDFFLRGVKYANGNAQDKNFKAYMTDEYLPNAAKKLAVYWTLFGAKLQAAQILNKTQLGKDIIALYTASQVIPFIGIILEDAPENMLESIYDAGVAKAKILAGTIKQKIAQPQPAAA